MAELNKDALETAANVLKGQGFDVLMTMNEWSIAPSAGTGGPYFSLETAIAAYLAALPASEGVTATDIFIADVSRELKRARAKFPGDRIKTIALAEEFGELCKAMLDETGDQVWKEAVQTAVMAARVAIDGDSSIDEWRAAKGLDDHRCGFLRATLATSPTVVPPPRNDAEIEIRHVSDCAVHNEPAMPRGRCDCGANVDAESVRGIIASEIRSLIKTEGGE